MGGQEAFPPARLQTHWEDMEYCSHRKTNNKTPKPTRTPMHLSFRWIIEHQNKCKPCLVTLQAEGSSQQKYHASKIAPGFLSAPIQEPSVKSEVLKLHFTSIPLFFLFYLQ